MKKILIFSTAYLPMVGGAEIAVKELTDRIVGYEFDLITSRLDRKLPIFERLGGVNVYRVGFGNKFDKFLLPLFGLWRSIRLDRVKHYQIIFSLLASQASIAAALFKIIQPDKKLVLNLQEGDEEEHLKRYALGNDLLYRIFIRPWHLLVFKKADLVVALSGYLKNRALANGVKCQVEVVPNGVDVKKFKVENLKFKIKELKDKLNIKESDKVIITISRLVKKNGVGDLIEAVRYLPANVKLIIIGGGELESSCKLKISHLKLADRVIMLGAMNNGVVPEYLAIADVFVRPSLSEGQGISFLEAMAAGVPVVATPVGGIVDFLHDGQTGLFCEVNNSQSIAEKVKIYLANRELTEKIKTQARELIIKKYDWGLISERMKNIFNELTS
ncbi:MAG: glycosyltransferase family 4 protein [Patescibacteria group bacterium]|nr:glycosyltransferase family 4 protein [Patescibacteria group bacterium]